MAPAELRADSSARDLLLAATERLRDAGSPTPRLDAELLVSHAFARDRAWLHAHADAELTGPETARLADWIARRAQGEPVAYLRGFKEWLSLRIAVDRRALIPRPETELLAETAMREIADRLGRDRETVRVGEVGTGSGAVAVALATRFRTSLALGRIRLAATDISPEAVELAAENLAAHGAAGLVRLACGDLLEPLVLGEAAVTDVLVANLPYLTSDEVARREGSIGFEPALALDGGPDGLDVIRRLLRELPGRLARDGVALLEIGEGQGPGLVAEVERIGMRAAVSILPDLAGIGRLARVAPL